MRIGEIVGIGKESNKLEEVEAGLIHSEDSVYITYPDPARDDWERMIRPKLQEIPLSVQIAESGISRRTLVKYRRGHARPRLRYQRLLAEAVSKILARLK